MRGAGVLGKDHLLALFVLLALAKLILDTLICLDRTLGTGTQPCQYTDMVAAGQVMLLIMVQEAFIFMAVVLGVVVGNVVCTQLETRAKVRSAGAGEVGAIDEGIEMMDETKSGSDA
jgi:hypothetical protein